MKDIIFLYVMVELTTTLPTIDDAIIEIQQNAHCLVTDTPNVEIERSKIIIYEHNSKHDGTQS